MNTQNQQHEEKYGELFDTLSINEEQLIIQSVFSFITKKYSDNPHPITKLKELYQEDNYLNNIPLKFWDELFIKMKPGLPSMSLGEGVCLLKYTIKRYILSLQ